MTKLLGNKGGRLAVADERTVFEWNPHGLLGPFTYGCR
jgi:hypothetical protein